MTKEVPLTQGKVALVDDEDYNAVIKYKWCVEKGGKHWYAVRGIWQPLYKNTKILSMHRFLLNPESNDKSDHINGNGLDNRRCNIRIVTHAQNKMNSEKYLGNTNKYKGAYWSKRDKSWKAEIYINGKTKHLGTFKNDEDAAHAYDEAAKKYFGEYARLNFPEEK